MNRTDSGLRIGNGQGFWGDSMRGPVQLVSDGDVDYLTMDFLAEITMSIMQKLRSRDANAGYATDFVKQMERILPTCIRKGIRIVANAGGVNPSACAQAVADVIRRLGLNATVAAVSGDDILGDLDSLVQAGHKLANLDTGEPLAAHIADVQSANVYLGALPIAQALGQGADIVVTGRVTDPSLTLGPLIYEFGWAEDDYAKLSAGTIAGHILECGTQSTGGNYDRWCDVPDLANIGYPIVEFSKNGTFVVTKKTGTGGLVDIGTVTSQLLYELGDPRRYLSPDVTADFTSVHLDDVGSNRVRVSGVSGYAPTSTYKVSIGVADGWKATAQLTVGGPSAAEKASLTAEILFERLRNLGVKFADGDALIEVLGQNVLYQGMVDGPACSPSEVVLRMSVRSRDRGSVTGFGDEFASLLTSGPPGLTGFAGGRPKASQIIGFWPALLEKSTVRSEIHLLESAK